MLCCVVLLGSTWSHLRVYWELWVRFIDAITARLDLIVADYRKVAMILEKEKRIEKQKLKVKLFGNVFQSQL